MKLGSNGYLHTDHWDDAVASLEAAYAFYCQTATNLDYWKWCLIAVHSAVQGFMVLALEQGNSLLVMKNDIAAKWLEAHESGKSYPQEKNGLLSESVRKSEER